MKIFQYLLIYMPHYHSLYIGFNWTRDDIVNPNKAPLTYHEIVEAFKFAYAPNTFLGDPAFTNYTKDVREFLANHISVKLMKLKSHEL